MGFNEKEEGQAVVSNTRIAGVVRKVLAEAEDEKKQAGVIESLEKRLGKAEVKFCTPEGLCFKDQASLDSYMAKRKTREIAKKRAENEKTISVPELRKLDEVGREAMSESEKAARRQRFQHILDLSNSSFVDAYNMIRHSPQDYAVLRERIIKSMTDSELEGAFLKCTGAECEVLRTNLVKRGYRIQKKDQKKDKWNPLDQEEQEKKESHF